MRDGKIREKNVFRRRTNRILPLRFGSPSASTEVVHRPRSQSPLHFDIFSQILRASSRGILCVSTLHPGSTPRDSLI